MFISHSRNTIPTYVCYNLHRVLLTPCLLGTAGGEVEFGSGDLGGSAGYPAERPSFCGSGGRSADILALREGCWLLVCALVLVATGGRPVVLEPDPGEFFLFKGTGAPGVGGVTCRGFGIGTGPDAESD